MSNFNYSQQNASQNNLLLDLVFNQIDDLKKEVISRDGINRFKFDGNPEIFPIIDSVYDQKPRMINQEILNWHYKNCLEDAARNSRRK